MLAVIVAWIYVFRAHSGMYCTLVISFFLRIFSSENMLIQYMVTLVLETEVARAGISNYIPEFTDGIMTTLFLMTLHTHNWPQPSHPHPQNMTKKNKSYLPWHRRASRHLLLWWWDCLSCILQGTYTPRSLGFDPCPGSSWSHCPGSPGVSTLSSCNEKETCVSHEMSESVINFNGLPWHEGPYKPVIITYALKSNVLKPSRFATRNAVKSPYRGLRHQRFFLPWKLKRGKRFDMVDSMMTSSNGNFFRVTGHLCREFTGHRWIPHTKANDAELWCFLSFAPE